MFSTLIQAIVLGLVQGATEFIPISSSAHLILVPWLFGWTDPALTSLSFDVALHLGTLLAVLVYFARDWVCLIRAGVDSIAQRKIGSDPQRKMAWYIIIGTIPGGVVGFLAESKIDALFHTPGQPIQPAALFVMAAVIAVLGSVLFLVDRYTAKNRAMGGITLKDSILIGLSQALSIFPGVSRSGSTMTTGLAVGLQRESAARFSFYLSAPIIAGVGLKSLLEIYQGIQAGTIPAAEWALFPAGILAAAVSGLVCIRFMLSFLQRHSMVPFAVYRWALALLIVGVVLAR